MKRINLIAMVGLLFAGLTYLFLPVEAQAAWQAFLSDSGLVTHGVGMAMIVNAQAVNDLFVAIKTAFNKALNAEPGDWMDTATEIPSNAKSNLYKWFGRFPKMRKWVGDKFVKNLEAYEYTLKNEPYETTIEVLRDDMEDDNTGMYTLQATDAGQSAREWPGDLVDAVKNAAFGAVCYDGQFFYDTDHPVKGVSVSNRITAALSGASLAAALASYGAARTAMMGFTDEEGQNLKLIPNILEVPPALETAARIICEQDKFTDGATNPYKGTATVKVNPGLTDATAWMLHCTKKAIKPFIYQKRKAPVFVKMTNPESQEVFMKGVFLFGAEARGNAGYSFWQMSVGGKP